MERLRQPHLCDPCFAASDAADSCRQQRGCTDDTPQCDWVLGLNKTLAFSWNERKVRGWGNFWPYLRTAHFAAALLGRRLLLVHNESLPTSSLMLGGRLSWRLPHGEAAGYTVVRNAEVKEWNHAHNTTGLIEYLDSLAHVPHLYLDVTSTYTISKYVLLMKECPKVGAHVGFFLGCMGRLFSSPSPRMAMEVDRLRARLPQAYTAVHMRTFGADMHIPQETTPDPEAALRFLAWEITYKNGSGTVPPAEYAVALRRVCANASAALYVAADSRAAVLMTKRLCPGNVVSLPRSYGQVSLNP